ncbi:peptidase domain-containing ABC transporter [Fluviispira multicolorata]|uniref:ATP-binding cassette domain-containing protein n=1 Tax=Fluviispira multicolorata TaxID=2654512 RepID=A0A833JBN7_9BACT|nr:peptidase domain-containing ABC transporter [Fluviispira multicolorata]KAB8028439.1 ATP-binding cassette domain-containing protein [Fluviispira multicolorata]
MKKLFVKKPKIKLVLQNEISECGLACISMITSYYNKYISLTQLRHKFPVPITGMSLKNIVNILNILGYKGKVLRIEMEHLKTLKFPVIAHWEFNHFIILSAVDKNYVYVYDPAFGKKEITLNNFSDSFTGVILAIEEYNSSIKIEKLKEISIISKIKDKYNYKKFIFVSFIFGLLSQLLLLYTPVYMQKIIDSLNSKYNPSLLEYLVFCFLGVKFLEIGLFVLKKNSVINIGVFFNYFFSKYFLSHIFKLNLSFFQKRYTGDIISKFESIDRVRQLVADILVEGLVEIFLFVIVTFFLFYYNAYLSLIVIFSSLFYIIIRFKTYNSYLEKQDQSILMKGLYNSSILETINGIQSIKIFNCEKIFEEKIENKYVDFLNANAISSKMNIYFFVLKSITSNAEQILIIFLGVNLIRNQVITIGSLYAFITYKALFSNSLYSLIDTYLNLKIFNLHKARLIDVLHEQEEKKISQNNDLLNSSICALQNSFESLELRNISYVYDGCDGYLFKNISFTIRKGERIGISAPSGCGKSTLVKIILSLIPFEGEIFLNGVQISIDNIHIFRKKIGAVMQNDTLFSGSIVDNVTLFSSNKKINFAIECLKKACVYEEILKFPLGIDTLIGDMGSILSGGQKQRVMLARALYREPELLVLDESSSHLDPLLEEKINAELKTLNITCLIIAHRKETLNICEKIIHLQEFRGY